MEKCLERAAAEPHYAHFPLTAQVAFMLAYATVGWCPPAAILRRLGFRTRQEIDAERLALIGHLAR